MDPAPTPYNPRYKGGEGFVERKDIERIKVFTGNHQQDRSRVGYPQAFFVSRELLKRVLFPEEFNKGVATQQCNGLRIYLAQEKKGAEPYLVIVGTTYSESLQRNIDLLPTTNKDEVKGAAQVATYFMIQTDDKCPSNCDVDGRLYTKR
ncbi:hypothetical protein GCM10027175_16310 [Hymenobacter latericoloratus]